MAVAPSHFASAQSNTVAVTINVGDTVFVLINNADGTTPAGLTDGTANIYALIKTDTAQGGSSSLYVSINVPNAATSVSFTAGHNPGIVVGTFTGADGVGVAVSNDGSSTNPNVSVTTKVANSYVVALFSFISAGNIRTATAGTGTLQSNYSSSATVNGGAIVSEASATPGSFTPSITLATTNWVALAVEVWSATYYNYVGKVPPLMYIAVKVYDWPKFSSSGPTPVTPVPVAVVLLSGTNGVAYSETITAQGGSGTGYTYALLSGALPTGTSLSSGGVISGTPSANGTYTFVIQVTDSLGNTGSQNFQITIAAPASSGGGIFSFLN